MVNENKIKMEEIYEMVKNKEVGFKDFITIGNENYLVFIRPDKGGGTEVVFRKLIKEN